MKIINGNNINHKTVRDLIFHIYENVYNSGRNNEYPYNLHTPSLGLYFVKYGISYRIGNAGTSEDMDVNFYKLAPQQLKNLYYDLLKIEKC